MPGVAGKRKRTVGSTKNTGIFSEKLCIETKRESEDNRIIA